MATMHILTMIYSAGRCVHQRLTPLRRRGRLLGSTRLRYDGKSKLSMGFEPGQIVQLERAPRYSNEALEYWGDLYCRYGLGDTLAFGSFMFLSPTDRRLLAGRAVNAFHKQRNGRLAA